MPWLLLKNSLYEKLPRKYDPRTRFGPISCVRPVGIFDFARKTAASNALLTLKSLDRKRARRSVVPWNGSRTVHLLD
jgi:hypothetical protein